MKRVIDVDMEVRCKKLGTALNKFFKKYPELEYWREQLEYMGANQIDHDSDDKLQDGIRNSLWSWALHLYMEEDYFYIAVIERA